MPIDPIKLHMVSDTRRLAAIMFTDMVGYSALACADEALAIEVVHEQRKIVRSLLAQHGGRERQTMGDGFFVEFSSAVQAVQCACTIQERLLERARHAPKNRVIRLRIGIHLGEVLADDRDLYGTTVNTAARIEPLAPVGGICITRQVYDSVFASLPQLKFKSLGRQTLKNISGEVEIYDVRPVRDEAHSPWEWLPVVATEFLKAARQNGNVALLSTLFALVFAIGAWSAFESIVDRPEQKTADNKVYADLKEGWMFQAATGETPDPARWQPFNPMEMWKYADLIRGQYWMRKEFKLSDAPGEPAIVLGMIADSHRAFLNGHFIGGSDDHVDLIFYSFDRSLLDLSGTNAITIRGVARPSIIPMLFISASTGAFLGDLSLVRSVVKGNDYRLRHGIYFTLALLMFIACFVYAFANRRTSNTYFYCSLILLLGTMHLSFYLPWLNNLLDYRQMFLLKLLGVSLPQFVLFSAYLHIRGMALAEARNNLLTAVFICTSIAALIMYPHVPSTFTNCYNAIYIATLFYTFTWLSWAVWKIAKSRVKHEKIGVQILVNFHVLFLVMAIFGFCSCFEAMKNSTRLFMPVQMRVFVFALSMATPFLFALLMVAVTTFDHLKKAELAKVKTQRDKLMQNLLHIMRSSGDPHETISRIQTELCQHFRAERSTLYVFNSAHSKQVLAAGFVAGLLGTGIEVKRSLSPDEGVIGYSLKNSMPLIFDDIRNDSRFFGHTAKFPVSGQRSYRTGSCMIFPLYSGQTPVGVLTFADSNGDQPFGPADFTAGLEVSPSLALLLENHLMRQALSRRTSA